MVIPANFLAICDIILTSLRLNYIHIVFMIKFDVASLNYCDVSFVIKINVALSNGPNRTLLDCNAMHLLVDHFNRSLFKCTGIISLL